MRWQCVPSPALVGKDTQIAQERKDTVKDKDSALDRVPVRMCNQYMILEFVITKERRVERITYAMHEANWSRAQIPV